MDGVSDLQFEVTKAIDISFSRYERVIFDPQIGSDGLYFAIDPWNGTLMYYRVKVITPDGTVVDISSPLRAIDQNAAVFVSPLGLDFEGCGNLQNGPCKSIKAALSSAISSGAAIYATPGEFSGEGNFEINVSGSPVTITSTNGPQYTVINCTENGYMKRGFTFISGESADTVVEGFTILGGEAGEGGCMLIRNSSPTIKNMAFVDCKAVSGIARGGGIYIEGSGSNPVIETSLFYYNRANEGGAIHVTNGATLTLSNSVIDLGICASGTGLGGGMYGQNANIKIESSVIKNCISAFAGGGMMFHDCTVSLNSVEVLRNTVTNTGAGINLFGSTMQITNSRFAEVRLNVYILKTLRVMT